MSSAFPLRMASGLMMAKVRSIVTFCRVTDKISPKKKWGVNPRCNCFSSRVVELEQERALRNNAAPSARREELTSLQDMQEEREEGNAATAQKLVVTVVFNGCALQSIEREKQFVILCIPAML